MAYTSGGPRSFSGTEGPNEATAPKNDQPVAVAAGKVKG
eukprot:CAMPEP_0204341638 /NCGR_PEP_ID=MMETSP0469-20131031/23511_1 /ASSEMBLY_ACC=CAM_ASM_000384 /TAXON_ID=2969 /ORGANISM="Oxyrrhis marina" /LENGTH=38 /DNA_ID= /DNA_START= /DNA_END= /DNA_ORIENTATION=